MFASLKGCIERGETDRIEALLATSEGASLLRRAREQKTVLRADDASRSAVAAVLTSAADRVLPPAEAEKFGRYLEYVLTVDIARREWQTHLRALASQVREFSDLELLAAGGALLRKMGSQLWRTVNRPGKRETVANYERRIHHAQGDANDLVFAIARAINELAKARAARSSSLRTRALTDNFAGIVQLAAHLESFDYTIDSVAYGDFEVRLLAPEPQPRIRFDHADPSLSLLRTLATRRRMVSNLAEMRAPRYVRERLRELVPLLLDAARQHYQAEYGRSIVDERVKRQVDGRINELLIEIDAEDDLLYAAAGRASERVACYYAVGLAIRIFALVGSVVRRNRLERRRVAAPVTIPLLSISALLDQMAGSEVVFQALDALTCELPARSHFDLLRRPFLRLGDHVAAPVLGAGVGAWNLTVREALVVGGELGNELGATWEEFYATTFADTDWEIVGRRVRLRKEGRQITEVDMMLQRGDLLLVLQIKALIGSGVTVYDHWKNRKTVEWGCAQARLAADYLHENRGALVGIVGGRRAKNIKVIQPTVLTTVSHFNGWSHQGVPVISEAGRKGITEGVRVHFQAAGQTLHTHEFLRKEQLSTETILWSLQNSIEALVAPESLDCVHEEHQIGRFLFEVPSFALRDPDDVLAQPAVVPRAVNRPGTPSPRRVRT